MLAVLLLGCSPNSQSPPKAVWTTYHDPVGRFEFAYPDLLGPPRAARSDEPGSVVTLEVPIHRKAGGEDWIGRFVVTSGRVDVPLLALGPLYDSSSRRMIVSAQYENELVQCLPSVTPQSFRFLMEREHHLRPNLIALRAVPDPVIERAAMYDSFWHADPQVIHCRIDGKIVVFHETVRVREHPEERAHVFGAVRFMEGDWSSVQYIQRVSYSPGREELEAMRTIVASFQRRNSP